MALSAAAIAAFEADGFVHLDGAFAPALAAECRDWLWRATGLVADDPAAWTEPVVRLPGSTERCFIEALESPALCQAYDALVGPGRWKRFKGVGTFPIRFPSEVDPGDAGWHVDASFLIGKELRLELHSRARALLVLPLFSDVGPDDAPTRIRVGSHLDVPRVLAQADEGGVTTEWLMPRLSRWNERPVAHATGRAGDAWLCHPFLVHAASWPHRGTRPRFMAQQCLHPTRDLDLDAPLERATPVERAVIRALGGGAEP